MPTCFKPDGSVASPELSGCLGRAVYSLLTEGRRGSASAKPGSDYPPHFSCCRASLFATFMTPAKRVEVFTPVQVAR